MSDRENPDRPVLSVSCAVFHENRVLMVRRTRDPYAGCWSLPGGVVEPGETVPQAVRREVLEETGIAISEPQLSGLLDSIIYGKTEDTPLWHYVIAVHAARYVSGTASAGDDAGAVAWIEPDALDSIKTTPDTPDHVRSCRALLD